MPLRIELIVTLTESLLVAWLALGLSFRPAVFCKVNWAGFMNYFKAGL